MCQGLGKQCEQNQLGFCPHGAYSLVGESASNKLANIHIRVSFSALLFSEYSCPSESLFQRWVEESGVDVSI